MQHSKLTCVRICSLFAVMKPFTTGHTLNGLYLYSVDKSEWGPALLKIFHKERLTVQFGGSAPPQRLYNLTPEQIAIQLGPSFSPPTTKIKNWVNGSAGFSCQKIIYSF